MRLLLDCLLPISIEKDLLAGLYSNIDPYLLSEIVDLLLTKSSVPKTFINRNCFKTKTSNDFTDVYFYLTLQNIPKILLKIIKPEKNLSKVNFSIVYTHLNNK